MEPLGELNLPPLPPLSWAHEAWNGEAVLGAWAGFQSRNGPYDSQDSSEPSDGSVRVRIEVPYEDQDARPSPTPAQIEAWKYLLENQDAIRDAVLNAIFVEYPDWREEFDPDDGAIDEWMPILSNRDELKPLMGLSFVHIPNVALDGVAYIGFEMGCTWEVEHGLGAMTHRTRVIHVGYADTAFSGWAAEEDMEAHSKAPE